MSIAPTLPGVAPATLEKFLTLAKGPDNAPLEIVQQKGRCLRVRRKDWLGFTDWHEWSSVFLGNGNPCEEFRVDGCSVIARLKTAEQSAADDVGFDVDEAHGELPTYWPFLAEGQRASRAPRADRKAKPISGAPAIVLGVIKELAPTGVVTVDAVIESAIPRLPNKPDSRGQDRRRDYARRAITKLIETKEISARGEGDISLTAAEVDE